MIFKEFQSLNMFNKQPAPHNPHITLRNTIVPVPGKNDLIEMT